MLLSRKSVELLAPVGTWEVLEAAITAGADAVYLGGKRFNMRMHRTDTNFDDELLVKAIKYAHERNVLVYITVNNLISEQEIDAMRDYLKFLDQIKPDALIVQDLAILELAKEINFSVPLHSSVMMNTHNEEAINKLKEYGITRVVVGREMTLDQMSTLKDHTGIEIEYFMHGDMCISHSGQCFHSGVLFGQSSNRGRCLKPCRWPFTLIDEDTNEVLDENGPGDFKLALKDMCMYRNIPELIQAGVHSFKIEGRMRTAAFVEKIVRIYRQAIDAYINDPTGYRTDEEGWHELYENRSRDFSTCFALGKPDANAIGFTGKREPRFFSQAVKEASVSTLLPAKEANPFAITTAYNPEIAVKVRDLPSLEAACQNGAGTIYIGGEAFLPENPWKLNDIKTAITTAHHYNAKLIVNTPRITGYRELGELTQLFHSLNKLKPDGLLVSNIGVLNLAHRLTDLPIITDYSFNIFNHLSARLLKANGATRSTISIEATYNQYIAMLKNATIPLEFIIHGSLEAMILDHSLPTLILGSNHLEENQQNKHNFALLDSANEKHPIKIDQYNRNHILFAKDLCLLKIMPKLLGAQTYRIEGQHYSPALIALLTKTYVSELKQSIQNPEHLCNDELIATLENSSPRKLGIGSFRYRVSR